MKLEHGNHDTTSRIRSYFDPSSGYGSATELKELIGTTAQLTFQAVIGKNSSSTTPSFGNEVLPSLDEEEYSTRLKVLR